ncbi:MAG: hypothetical protein COU31_00555 [Candidatus Magasanikbacteria bacterium CG10_big_fil_rev_8_21_14_0_10_40_10]|uniref:Uncharacterized protein n=1 Tax=Candidatus Magasanikbacteria bacterium CG10_big_fil_rev_8_21_14_0_10_40_10 TaxID=1974648 RepID=A0A2M6W528_9BACT|nr:MAG: hypothetical protein COU31_00555 [Candidatus Magasanikbacteria bacterium CG10_big_fil_rev_8_21_14_0_10_40_10]
MGDNDLQKLKERHDRLQSLYLSLRAELDEIAKDEKELEKHINEVIDKQKMSKILNYIKNIKE